MKPVINLSVFDRSHQVFIDALNAVQNPEKVKNLPSSPLLGGEGGTSFGKLGKTLGSGGSGTVIYEIMKLLKPIVVDGEEQRREEPVVVKFFRFTTGNQERQKEDVSDLIKEARVLALLGKHPNIVGLIDVSLAENGMCLFMEMGKGNLKDQIRKYKEDQGVPPRSRDVLNYAQDILGGIAHMHKYRVYHLDMKPENVIICKGNSAKIIDFGLSRGHVLQTKTERLAEADWSSMGTTGYIGPESWDWGMQDKAVNDVDLAKRDSYAVGMTIIDGLLSPFLGSGFEVVKLDLYYGRERKPDITNRTKIWKDRLRGDAARTILKQEGLLDLAEATLGLIEDNPSRRLTVQDALLRIQKNLDIVKKKGMFEITKI